jgi:hypothetical protein
LVVAAQTRAGLAATATAPIPCPADVSPIVIGDVLPVRYDPEDHSKVVVDTPALTAKSEEIAARDRIATAEEQAQAVARGKAKLHGNA